MVNPSAAYDALAVVEGFSAERDRALDGEVQAIAYLAFLLSISSGEQSDFWGYDFVATDNAAPFSATLDQALTQLSLTGFIAVEAGRYSAVRSAGKRLQAWGALSANRRRRPYLRAALRAAVALSLPILVRALSLEPQLSRAESLGASRRLPDELGLPDLLADLAEVDSVLDEQGLAGGRESESNLFTRAQLWLSYLSTLTAESDSSPV